MKADSSNRYKKYRFNKTPTFTKNDFFAEINALDRVFYFHRMLDIYGKLRIWL